jgi:hypothetical protein
LEVFAEALGGGFFDGAGAGPVFGGAGVGVGAGVEVAAGIDVAVDVALGFEPEGFGLVSPCRVAKAETLSSATQAIAAVPCIRRRDIA